MPDRTTPADEPKASRRRLLDTAVTAAVGSAAATAAGFLISMLAHFFTMR